MSVVPRAEWGHPGPVGRAMRLPATTLWIHHSVTQARNGVATPRQIANIGIARFGRSSYSYVVTPDGTIYELQGTHVGAHTGGHNSTTLALCFAGNYERDEPTAAQIAAAGQLHRDLVAGGMLRPGAPIKGHRDASGASTACPGSNLYAALPRISEAAAGDAPTEEDDVKFNEKQIRELQHLTNRGINESGGWEGTDLTALQVDGVWGTKSALAAWHLLERIRLAVPKDRRPNSLYVDHEEPSPVMVGYFTAAVSS